MGSIEKIHEMLVSKECSCTELTKNYLDEIEKADGELNAYVNVTGEEALKTAEAVDRKIASGEEIGMLEGVPMTLKDNISTKGIETTCCSKILTGYKPIYNATVWETLAGENAVMLGKTNMDEFAMGSSCETSYFGGAMNPFDSNYVSGGSSGGVASAVGANIAAYGLGSDTGGSIRQPASFCGIVGLKLLTVRFPVTDLSHTQVHLTRLDRLQSLLRTLQLFLTQFQREMKKIQPQRALSVTLIQNSTMTSRV